MPEHKLLLQYTDDPNHKTVAGYESKKGYTAWRKVLTSMKPEDVIAEMKGSGLRGRGGAGFPTGLKWSFVPKDSPKPRYLICNADESEPGTCKDRVLLENDPHAVIEGMAIAAYSIGSHLAFNYIRGEFDYPIAVFEKAVEEAYAKGHLGKNIYGSGFDLDMITHSGGGAYICGEETALINSLAGERGMSSMKPPFPAVEGLYGCPTVVNNVETLAVGYRSPKTNQMLASKSNAVATKSYHMRGMAIDIAMPDVKLSHLREAAISLKLGGVGYYPKSGFVHVDTGPVRLW